MCVCVLFIHLFISGVCVYSIYARVLTRCVTERCCGRKDSKGARAGAELLVQQLSEEHNIKRTDKVVQIG